MKYLIFLAMLTITTELQAVQKETIDWHNTEIVIRGDYLRAVLVAHNDFVNRMSSRHGNATDAVSAGDKELAEYLSKLENYNIEVGAGHGRYFVWVTPRSSDRFPVVFGGDAFYVIKAGTFDLLEKKYGK